MKKILVFLMLGVLTLTSCHRQKVQPVVKELDVEQITNSNKQDMNTKYNQYRWYETCVVLKDFMDEECDGTVESVSNVFQVVSEDGSDVHVIMYNTTLDSTEVDVKHGFWVEDFPLDSVKISFKEAFKLMNEVNLPKPHSRHVVLREEIGPNEINPQWIFGNIDAQIYVDAITGNVTDEDPAF